jgi:hypothetical protein
VQKYGNRIPPYAETTNYVASILAELRWRKQQRERPVAGAASRTPQN